MTPYVKAPDTHEDVEIDDYTPIDGIPGAWVWIGGVGPFWYQLTDLVAILKEPA